jgi:arginase
MTYDLAVLGAPSSAGAYAPGQEKAPAAFRAHGLFDALARVGLSTLDCGDTPMFRWRPDPVRPKAMNLPAVAEAARAVADRVTDAFDKAARVLVLGGDCTVELGTVAGALRKHASVGLLYIDLDVDLNAPDTSDGALDWTGVAHLLDIPGAAQELTRIGPRTPMLQPADVMFFAAGEITAPEAETIARLRLPVVSVAEMKRDPARAIARALQWASSFECLLVHVDADVLAYTSFPIAENVRRTTGLDLPELSEVLNAVTRAPNFKALTLTEVNPDHAPDEPQTFGKLIRTLGDCLGSPSIG